MKQQIMSIGRLGILQLLGSRSAFRLTNSHLCLLAFGFKT